MKEIRIETRSLPREEITKELEERGILTNRYADEFFSHPAFSACGEEEVTVVITSLEEAGLEDGGTLGEIFRHLETIGLRPCPVNAGLFLRLQWDDQPQSENSILSGTHRAPDASVTVLSEIIEADDAFPKGLYLRNVGGTLWLRGYVCDDTFRFSGSDLFAFRK